MFYVKVETDEATIKVEINDENVYNSCPICGKETPVSLTDLASDGEFDLYGTAVFCRGCAEAEAS